MLRPDSPVSAEIDRTPLLTVDQERQLTRRAARGDPDARDLLVRANLRLVLSIASRYRRRSGSLTEDDMVQEGILGLTTAIDRFEPERGLKLSTYATWWIRQAITATIADRGDTIRKPRGHADRTPVVRASLDAPVGSDDDGRETCLGDLLADAGSIDTPDAADRALALERVHAALDSLPRRDREILRLRFGLREPGAAGEPMTMREVAAVLRISAERVRQLERKALDRLRLRFDRSARVRVA